MSTGDAVVTKKAEQELVRKQEKENQKTTPKKRKENLATKTPCRKSNAAKMRKALWTIQTPKQVFSTPDFELGPPVPGLSPSSCTKAVSSPIKKEATRFRNLLIWVLDWWQHKVRLFCLTKHLRMLVTFMYTMHFIEIRRCKQPMIPTYYH